MVEAWGFEPTVRNTSIVHLIHRLVLSFIRSTSRPRHHFDNAVSHWHYVFRPALRRFDLRGQVDLLGISVSRLPNPNFDHAAMA